MYAKEVEFTPGISHWEEKRAQAWARQKGICLPERDFITICQIALQGEQYGDDGEQDPRLDQQLLLSI